MDLIKHFQLKKVLNSLFSVAEVVSLHLLSVFVSFPACGLLILDF